MRRANALFIIALVLTIGTGRLAWSGGSGLDVQPDSAQLDRVQPSGAQMAADRTARSSGHTGGHTDGDRGEQIVGHIGGPGLAVLVRGDYAYVAFSSELAAIDISDPQHPQRVGYLLIPARQLAAEGDYLYVGGQDGLYILDIAQPQNPRLLATYPTPHPVFGIAVDQGFAYLAVDRGGLLVVDVAWPTAPVQVAAVATKGFAWGVTVADGAVYLADHLIGLHIFDALDPGAHTSLARTPTELVARGFLAMSDCLYDVIQAGDTVFATGKHGLLAIDVRDRELPRLGPEFLGPSCPRRLAQFGDHVFLAAEDAGLRIIHATGDPMQLAEVGHVADLGLAMDVAVANGYAYVADGEGRLHVVDVSTPAQPDVVGSLELLGLVWDVAVSGDYAYVLAGFAPRLYIVDISAPAMPRSVGSLALPHKSEGLTVVGDYVYLADWIAGLRIIDVSDKARPVEIGVYTTPTGAARAVVVRGGYAYLANDKGGFVIINVADPATPRAVSTLQLDGPVIDVALVGGYAYAATAGTAGTAGRGLQLVDVADPQCPLALDFAPPQDGVEQVLASSGLPVDFGNLVNFDKTLNVVRTNDHIFVAARMGGLLILRGEEFSSGEGLH